MTEAEMLAETRAFNESLEALLATQPGFHAFVLGQWAPLLLGAATLPVLPSSGLAAFISHICSPNIDTLHGGC